MEDTLQRETLKPDTLLKTYRESSALVDFLAPMGSEVKQHFHIKGWVGSQAAFLIAAAYRILERNIVVVLNDKEEALYFHNDLQHLMPRKDILLFPASYKRPYEIEEVDNANVLQRAEVLNALNHTRTGRQVVVTFAEALHEKVVNKRSLVKNTLEIKKGEACGMDFIIEVLETYGFEREEFVYEPGQFAVRGGLLDIFSFAHELPFRIEFFGEEIETIRTFDPVSQISDQELPRVSLIPNIQKNLLAEEKVSFLEYISDRSLLFIKSISFIEADLDRLFQRATESFSKLMEDSGGGATSESPESLYLDGPTFLDQLRDFSLVEIGKAPFYSDVKTLEWKGYPQPAFHKEFKLLLSHFQQNQEAGIKNYVWSENEKQIKRLYEIFEEIGGAGSHLFTGVLGDMHEGFSDSQLKIACFTDHQIFDRYHKYKAKAHVKRSQAITLKELKELNPGDYVTHVSHGIGQFAGLHTIQVGDHEQDVVKILYRGGDAIYVNVNSLHKISKYTGKEGSVPKLHKIGSGTWAKAKSKTKKRIKELAFDLVSVYAKRKSQPGFAFEPDGYLQQELEASFMYEDTPDQLKTTEEVKADMEKPHPMDRLICGDVGFGKTEIAIRAAFKAAVNGKQDGHIWFLPLFWPYSIIKPFSNRLKDMPVSVAYINRFKSNKEVKETLAEGGRQERWTS